MTDDRKDEVCYTRKIYKKDKIDHQINLRQMTVADTTPLNKIELLLKMVPFGLLQNKNKDGTQATH